MLIGIDKNTHLKMTKSLQLIRILVLIVVCSTIASAKISESLQELMKKGEKVNILINFDGTGDICRLGTPVLHKKLKEGRSNHLASLRHDLTQKMEKSQESVMDILSTQRAKSADVYSHYTQFWVTNQMIIGKADVSLIESIALDNTVTSIEEEPEVELLQFPEAKPNENDKPQSNLHQVKAPETWEALGSKGEGITIGFLDSGARLTHETLKDNWLGEYGWYDPITKKPEPFDPLGHGTYVT